MSSPEYDTISYMHKERSSPLINAVLYRPEHHAIYYLNNVLYHMTYPIIEQDNEFPLRTMWSMIFPINTRIFLFFPYKPCSKCHKLQNPVLFLCM